MNLETGLRNLENNQITIIKINFNAFEKVVSDQIVKNKVDNLTLVLLKDLQMIGKQRAKERKWARSSSDLRKNIGRKKWTKNSKSPSKFNL